MNALFTFTRHFHYFILLAILHSVPSTSSNFALESPISVIESEIPKRRRKEDQRSIDDNLDTDFEDFDENENAEQETFMKISAERQKILDKLITKYQEQLSSKRTRIYWSSINTTGWPANVPFQSHHWSLDHILMISDVFDKIQFSSVKCGGVHTAVTHSDSAAAVFEDKIQNENPEFTKLKVKVKTNIFN